MELVLTKNDTILHGRIFVLSAPSGAGKTTLVNNIKNSFSFLVESISCTTRKPRPTEVDGVDYYFLSEEAFNRKKEKELFAEWALVHGNYYGTPIDLIRENIEKGHHVICDIDYQGALNIGEVFKDEAVLIFVLPPSMDELEKRLRGRATDNEEIVQKRLENARNEISYYKHYDHIVVNDDVDKATELLKCIIRSYTEATALGNLKTLRNFTQHG